MKFDDVYLMVEFLLVAAFICAFLALGALAGSLILFFRLREKLRRLNAPIARDPDGRLYRERL